MHQHDEDNGNKTFTCDDAAKVVRFACIAWMVFGLMTGTLLSAFIYLFFDEMTARFYR